MNEIFRVRLSIVKLRGRCLELRTYYNRDAKGRFAPGGGSGLTDDGKRSKIHSSVKVRMPDGSFAKIAKGTQITKIYTFAGKGTKKPIRDAKRLAKMYKAPENEWKKVRGDGYVDDGKIKRHVELHWYESKTTGKIEMKVKRELK